MNGGGAEIAPPLIAALPASAWTRDLAPDVPHRRVRKREADPMDDPDDRAHAARLRCPFLTGKQAAFYLGVAEPTLRAMRAAGNGPRCRLHGRTYRYHIDDLDTWSEARAKGGSHG